MKRAIWIFGLATCAVATSARADDAPVASSDREELTIRKPDDHPDYLAELEVHGVVGYGGGNGLFERYSNIGFGPGFRANFRIVKNGFIPRINDNVAIGVGAELVFDSGNAVRFFTPVVMQWNFWLSTHWSVYGEVGVGFEFPLSTPNGNEDVYFSPVFAVGGRYNFNPHFALVMRAGFPVSSIGVSFFL